MKLILLMSAVATLMVLAWGCTYNNEEDLYPQTGCDTLNITFTHSIDPIFEARCVICHSGANPPAGHDFTTYDGIVAAINTGRLLPAIKHENGYLPMPKDSDPLTDCQISQIEKWINLGMPDN